MHRQLTPTQPKVEPGQVLNLTMRDDRGHLIYRQFLTLHEFDYTEILEIVRTEGHYKAEEVLYYMCDELKRRRLVREINTISLDIGEFGKASVAVQECRKQLLNPERGTVIEIAKEIEASYYDFNGPEGDLHVMKLDTGQTLGQIKIMIDTGKIRKTVLLDIIGPTCADFPEDLSDKVRSRLIGQFQTQVVNGDFTFHVTVNRSDLAIAEDSLLL